MSSASGLPAFNKPWLSITDQLALLESRGLTITDRPTAQAFLTHLSYYRFSGYCLAYEAARHTFRAGTAFTDVQAAYQFDVALRDLMTEAMEIIEVDVRSAVANIFGAACGAFGHLDTANFRRSFHHTEWKESLHSEVRRSKELFVIHFQNNYRGFPDLPCWIATEVMSFGSLSRLYSGLMDQYQSQIASRYNLQKGDLESALHHLCYIRNLCAHHSRLWDRTWAITPRLPHGKNWRAPLVPDPGRLFVTLLITYRLLKRCPSCDPFARDWRRRINALMQKPPATADPLTGMGMPLDWYKHPYWV